MIDDKVLVTAIQLKAPEALALTVGEQHIRALQLKEDSVREDWTKLKCPYCGVRMATSYWGDDPLPICDVCLKQKRGEAADPPGQPGTCLLSKPAKPDVNQ